jgi:hypothetical protein
MPADLEPATLDFFEDAPYRNVATEVVPRPAAAIFSAFAEDPAGWGNWYPGFSHTGRYVTPDPHGVGSVREVVALGVRFREQILAWDAPYRWAFSVEQASVSFARRFAEDYRIAPQGNTHSVVQWTLAIEPRPAMRVAMPLMGLVLPTLFRRAMANLAGQQG